MQSSLAPDQQNTLVLLAAAAMSSSPDDPELPDGWSLLCTLAPDGSQSPPVPRTAGFYAIGQLSAGGPTVAVLALGVSWAAFLEGYVSEGIGQATVPPYIDSDAKAACEARVTPMYAQMRFAIWNNLTRIGSYPLYVTGMAAGGPLAQLAAIDLRPGNAGPDKLKPPAVAPVCAVFSTPIIGNPVLAGLFKTSLPTAMSVAAGSDANAIDLFPSQPADGTAVGDDIYARLGSAQSLAGQRPQPYDDPWVERSPGYYQTLLGGSPEPPPTAPGRIVSPPAGFSQDMAYSLAVLCAAAYQFGQRSSSVLPFPTAPFVFKGTLSADGAVQAALFASDDAVAVAFRGPVSWRETVSYTTNSYRVVADFLQDDNAGVQQGALLLYNAMRDDLAAKLAPLVSAQKPVYLAGHDLGGVLAVLAAADLAVNHPELPVAGVYTFGAPPAGSLTFALSVYNGLTAQGGTLGSVTYHLRRPADFMPKAWKQAGYEQTDTSVRLDGVPPDDDATAHPLTGYIALLKT